MNRIFGQLRGETAPLARIAPHLRESINQPHRRRKGLPNRSPCYRQNCLIDSAHIFRPPSYRSANGFNKLIRRALCGSSAPVPPDQPRGALHREHCSLRIAGVHLEWARRFYRLHNTRHPREVPPPHAAPVSRLHLPRTVVVKNWLKQDHGPMAYPSRRQLH